MHVTDDVTSWNDAHDVAVAKFILVAFEKMLLSI